MTAQTRQTDLRGNTVREQPPTDSVAATLERLPQDTVLPAVSTWTQLAQERRTPRVLRWIERAAAEDAIVTEGGER